MFHRVSWEFATRSAILLTLVGCVGGSSPAESGPAGEPTEPAISVTPSQAPIGAEVTLTATGFPADTPLEIGFGPPQSEYSVVATARSSAAGAVDVAVRVPSWAETDRDYVWVIADTDNQPKKVTSTFHVTASNSDGSAATVRVEGQITDEGVECPALRSTDNTLYTLAGAPEWVSPGDSVVVTGTVAEMSFCMQGTTLDVAEVSRR